MRSTLPNIDQPRIPHSLRVPLHTVLHYLRSHLLRVMMDDVDIDLPTLGAQKLRRICCTASVGRHSDDFGL